MKLSKTFSNAGRLYTRHKKIDSLLKSLRTELDKTPAEDCTFLLGRIDSIEENRKCSDEKLVNLCVAVKRQIAESAEFLNENVFLEGYLRGIEDMLKMNWNRLDDSINLMLFVYSENDELLEKYRLALSAIGAFSKFPKDGLKAYISNNAENICSRILDLNEKTEHIVCVIYTKDCTPKVDTLQKLCFGQYHNVYLHKYNNEENIEKIISKLIIDAVV